MIFNVSIPHKHHEQQWSKIVSKCHDKKLPFQTFWEMVIALEQGFSLNSNNLVIEIIRKSRLNYFIISVYIKTSTLKGNKRCKQLCNILTIEWDLLVSNDLKNNDNRHRIFHRYSTYQCCHTWKHFDTRQNCLFVYWSRCRKLR